MKRKSLILLPFLALGLVACGGNTSSTENAASTNAGSSSVVTNSSTEKTTSANTPAVVETIFEKQFTFYSPGTTAEGEELTTIFDCFERGKHQGPNYTLYINLLKEDHKVEAGRNTLYYTGMCVNKAAFTTAGTWSVANGVYTINLDAFTYTVQGQGSFENPAVTLTTDADGNVTWPYKSPVKDSDPKEYNTKLVAKADFAGEWTGSFYSITDIEDGTVTEKQIQTIDSMEVTALADGSYTISGAIEESGISSYTGTISAGGLLVGQTPRLADGNTMSGLFYTEADGTAHFYMLMNARERKSAAYGTKLA